MSAFSLSPDGKLAIAASETSSKNDFDYLVGKWNIRNRTLKEQLAGSNEWDEFERTANRFGSTVPFVVRPLNGSASPGFSAASDRRSSSAGGRGGGAGRVACESMGCIHSAESINAVMPVRTENRMIAGV